MIKIGSTIRELRKNRSMTLKDLSGKMGISISALSGIERNKYSPSLDAVQKVSELFNVSMSQMLGEDKKECVRLIRNEGRKQVVSKDGKVKLEVLSGDDCGDAKISMQSVEIAPDGNEKFAHKHFGEEIIYVLEGEVQVNVGGNVYALAKSDCIHFDASIIHGINNSSDKISKVLITTTPPNHGSAYEEKASHAQH